MRESIINLLLPLIAAVLIGCGGGAGDDDPNRALEDGLTLVKDGEEVMPPRVPSGDF
ncbi:MAG: hypothetical protein LBT81_02175 [Helicobacteraceae bacterium]|nr:hypothetical protein [Helicobacteraceae bacterium]